MRSELSAPPNRLPRPLGSVALFFVLATIAAGVLTLWQRDGGGAEGPRNRSEVSAQASITPADGRQSSVPRKNNPSPAPTGTRQGGAGSPLSGDLLAKAWLRAFLTRDDRYDDRWVVSVALLSESDVVDDLRAAGPDAVGLQQLTSWRVERVDPVGATDVALDTPTRQVLAYAATVTDGVRTVQKPFVLYAYLDLDGTWRIGSVEQPYSSEG